MLLINDLGSAGSKITVLTALIAMADLYACNLVLGQPYIDQILTINVPVFQTGLRLINISLTFE